jgi:hypothetical protein
VLDPETLNGLTAEMRALGASSEQIEREIARVVADSQQPVSDDDNRAAFILNAAYLKQKGSDE